MIYVYADNMDIVLVPSCTYMRVYRLSIKEQDLSEDTRKDEEMGGFKCSQRGSLLQVRELDLEEWFV